MIFSIKDVLNVLSYEKELHANMLRDKYIQKAMGDINRSVINHFSKKYLFHRVYMISEEKTFEPLRFDDIVRFQDKISVEQIEFAEDVIRKDKQGISFAKIILANHFQGLVLYKGKKPRQLGNLLEQSFKPSDALSSLSKKLHVNPKDIRILYGRYKLHSQEITGDFYAYFIRPFAEHKHYNGVFLILLRRPLLENEFLELGYLWTKILSETALLKERDAEQDLIFEEQTHTWNTEITSITQHLDFIWKKYHSDKGDPLSKEIAQNIHAAYMKVQHLRHINAFNLFMMKNRHGEDGIPPDPVKMHLADRNMHEEFKTNPIHLKQLLYSVITTLRLMIESLHYIDPGSTKKELAALAKLEVGVKRMKDYTINTIEVGLRIVILDLLKNAILHADRSKPVIAMKVEEINHWLKIHFVNNSMLTREAYDYINSDKVSHLLPLRRKGGLRTIKRILSTRILSFSDIEWKVKAEKSSLTGDTDIILFIPLTDIL